ncbi:MAG TPA: ribosome maturation factor RimM [Burkholderiales bacterium]|nr:ribosome maturation factor RimM [Burkholderiales bacterium]
MGRITGAFGIKGWVKVQPFTATPKDLLAYRDWWVETEGGWQSTQIEESQVQGAAVAVRFAGCTDRDEAARYRGREVAVPREVFPEAETNEYYWADLIGLSVVNTQGEALGTVSRLFETGANDVLVVEGPNATERLIPFIEEVVLEVDLAGRTIRVDWGADF